MTLPIHEICELCRREKAHDSIFLPDDSDKRCWRNSERNGGPNWDDSERDCYQIAVPLLVKDRDLWKQKYEDALKLYKI